MPSTYYAAGTASVAAGGTVVTFVGASVPDVLLPGDTFERAGLGVTIASVGPGAQITLAAPWPGAALVNATYLARYDSPERYEPAYMAQQVRSLIDSVRILDDTVPYYRALAVNQNTPPATPSIDDTYVVGTAPTGLWAGQAKTIARWNGTSWAHTIPEGGWHAYSAATNQQFAYVAGSWQLTDGVASVAGLTGVVGLADLGAKFSAKGNIVGFTVSNVPLPGDIVSDLMIAPGEVWDHTGSIKIKLPSPLIKRIDGNWAPGTNQGGRYSGAVLNDGSYSLYAVAKADGLDPEVYITAPPDEATAIARLQTEPGGSAYMYARRIFTIPRRVGANVLITQIGDYVYLEGNIVERNSSAASADVLLAVTVPTGIPVSAIMAHRQSQTAGTGDSYVQMGPGYSSALQFSNMVTRTVAGGNACCGPVVIPTNLLGQIRFSLLLNGGATLTNAITSTLGWIDTRGRENF